MWGQGVYGTQILVLVRKFTFKVVLGVIFSHRLSLLLNIQIEKSDNFDPQFLKLALPLLAVAASSIQVVLECYRIVSWLAKD